MMGPGEQGKPQSFQISNSFFFLVYHTQTRFRCVAAEGDMPAMDRVLCGSFVSLSPVGLVLGTWCSARLVAFGAKLVAPWYNHP